jgi:hypothetical protein
MRYDESLVGESADPLAPLRNALEITHLRVSRKLQGHSV